MKLFFQLVFFLVIGYSCTLASTKTTENPMPSKNEVIVLGMIHDGHSTSETYGIFELKEIIRGLNPDIILTEIPPDRFPIAMEEFISNDTITEPRVSLFPEYVNVLFPLTKEMDFEMIPTAGWTKEMSDARREKFKEFREEEQWIEAWKEYILFSDSSDNVMNKYGSEEDPYFVNSVLYDSIVEIWAEPYNRLFNQALGDGGWDNINKAHYNHIENAIEQYSDSTNKRILITYGAGHKGWFLRELRKRDDILLLDPIPLIENALM